MDCPVCGGTCSLTVTFHEHGVSTGDGSHLVTVVSYACRSSDCSVPEEDLQRMRRT